jgi:hypothetical protein
MKLPFWIFLLGCAIAPVGVWAEDGFSIPLYDPMTHQDIAAPGQPTFTATPTATFSPVPTEPARSSMTPVSGTSRAASLSTPLSAPQWSEVKTVPGNISMSKKMTPWMSLMGLGLDIPASAHIQKGYALGFDLNLGSGYRLDNQWSLWLNLSLGQFSSRNDTLTQDNNFMMIEAAFWARYRITNGDFSPYFFAGPGMAYNENRNNQAAQYDPTTGNYYVPIDQYEVDFLTEGGLGLDLRAGDGFHIFLQGKIICDFTSPHFASYASMDSPVLLAPLELGVLFGY